MKIPNIILIVIDCLRTDQLSCYGSESVVAPTIERLASQGVVFEQNVAMGFHTLSTMPGLLTGTYPGSLGGFKKLSIDRPRLAVDLKNIGYSTAAFVPNPYLTPERGFNTGFDIFDEALPIPSRRSSDPRSYALRIINRILKPLNSGIECPPYLNANELTGKAIQWVEKVSSPFFLWMHYMDAHTPYHLEKCNLILPGGLGRRRYDTNFWTRLVHHPEATTPEDVSYARELYTGGITYIDQQIDHLLMKLDALKLMENTILIITADHGEAFMEHGACGHSNFLYDEIIRVPLIFYAPNIIASGKRISPQVRQIDLPPTIMNLIGQTPNPNMHGISFHPVFQGENIDSIGPAFSQTNATDIWEVSLRDYPWKLIWRMAAKDFNTVSLELYDLISDPKETKDLSNQKPDIVDSMRSYIETLIREYRIIHDNTNVEHEAPALDNAINERLRDLGYLD